MKSLKLLAEKYDVVQVKRSDEALVAAQTPGQLLEAFQELSQISGDVIVAFEHAITNRSSLIKENTADQDSDVRVAVLAMEKVLAHLDRGNDKPFCVAFESFAKNASLNEGDLDVLLEGKPGFFSKLGKGIKKYAGKALNVADKAMKAAPGAIGNYAGSVAKTTGQMVGGVAGGIAGAGKNLAAGLKQGVKGGYNTTSKAPGAFDPETNTANKKTANTTATNTTTDTTGQNPAADKVADKTKQVQNTTTDTTGQGQTVAQNTTPAADKANPAVATPAADKANPAAVQPGARKVDPKGAPAARQAVDTAVNALLKMRSDRRDGVVDYAIQKLTALKKGAAPAGQVATPTSAVPAQAAAESLVAESVERFYITTNKHFRK